jgi:hypothetical protein
MSRQLSIGTCVSGWDDVDLEEVLTLKKLKVALELGQDPCSKAGVSLPDVQGINVMMQETSPPSPPQLTPVALSGVSWADPLFASA